ncbi:MAG: hypothetical protein WC914_01830 [Proteiniphilum sp.]|jgi:hypothetical protein
MSRTCPLCGKTKPEEALFCDDCSRRIRADYEVGLPANAPAKTEVAKTFEEIKTGHEGANVPDSGVPPVIQPRRKKRAKTPLIILIAILFLAGAFLVYNETIRKGNLERSGWETALKLNSTGGYIAYMEAFPDGAHFDEAQAGLLRLKSEEAAAWGEMKASGNTAELRDFLSRHPESPYAPLIERQLDSLSWLGALRVNTSESYSDYLAQARRGELRGLYAAEADKRYAMLHQSFPVEINVLDSIRSTVGGFYAALSGTAHDGAYPYLAPVVRRFFNSGAASRERITGELLMARTRARGATLSFAPDIEAVQYERTANGNYPVNVPLTKSYASQGATERVPGYIVHLELNPDFRIVSIHETKPYPDAP